jgi:hypothetical protein
MQNRRTHYFPENDCRVVTGLLPNGEYGATRLDEDEGRIRGYGHSRLAAIADLVEAISNTEEEEERNGAAFAADHERDYRKHEVA